MKNIKITALVAFALIPGTITLGQATNGSQTIGNETRQAVMINVSQPVKLTSEALNRRFQNAGLNAKTRNGVTTYNRVVLSEISPDQLDIYTKVVRSTDNSSIVSMAVSRGYSGITNSPADSLVTENIKKYLETFVSDANNYSADVDINHQITEVNTEEKMYQRLLDEQSNLNKKKANIDSRLSEIQRELRVREEHIGKKKLELENARTKRNTLNSQ